MARFLLARQERPLHRHPLLRLCLRCLRLPDEEEEELESSESLSDEEVEESESDEESSEVEVEDEDPEDEELVGFLPLLKRFNANLM